MTLNDVRLRVRQWLGVPDRCTHVCPEHKPEPCTAPAHVCTCAPPDWYVGALDAVEKQVRECKQLAYPAKVVLDIVRACDARVAELRSLVNARATEDFTLAAEVAELRKRVEDAEAIVLPNASAANE